MKQMKDTIFKILCVFGLMAFAMNVIGSTGYLIYFKQYVFAVTNLAVCGFAFPFVRKMFKKLTE